MTSKHLLIAMTTLFVFGCTKETPPRTPKASRCKNLEISPTLPLKDWERQMLSTHGISNQKDDDGGN